MPDAPPADFFDRDAVEAWLKTQPQAVSVALAARAALRAAPAFSQLDWSRPHQGSAAVFSQCLRCVAASLFAPYGESREAVKRAAAEAADAASAAAAANRGNPADAAYAASYAAARTAADAHADRAAAHAAARAISAAAASAAYTAADIRVIDAYAADGSSVAAARADALDLQAGKPSTIRDVCVRPLWPYRAPGWATRAWEVLKSSLPPDEGWRVWIDWYEARLRGDPYDLALEEARVLEPTEEDWKDPKRANAKLAEIVARFRNERHADVVDAVERYEALNAPTDWRSAGAPPPRSDNRPPEPLQDGGLDASVDLTDLKRQPQSRDEAERWAGVARAVKHALGAALGWTAEKLDLFLTEAAKEAGKQVGGWSARLAALGVAGSMLDYAVGLAEIVDAARAFLATWGVPL